MTQQPTRTTPDAIQSNETVRTGAFIISLFIAESVLLLTFWFAILIVAATDLRHVLHIDTLRRWVVFEPLNLLLAIGAVMISIKSGRRIYPTAKDVVRITPGCLQGGTIIVGGLTSLLLAFLIIQLVWYFVLVCC